MNNLINQKINLLWGQIRNHCKSKRREDPNSYWFPFFKEEIEKRIFAIRILKELRGNI